MLYFALIWCVFFLLLKRSFGWIKLFNSWINQFKVICLYIIVLLLNCYFWLTWMMTWKCLTSPQLCNVKIIMTKLLANAHIVTLWTPKRLSGSSSTILTWMRPAIPNSNSLFYARQNVWLQLSAHKNKSDFVLFWFLKFVISVFGLSDQSLCLSLMDLGQ